MPARSAWSQPGRAIPCGRRARHACAASDVADARAASTGHGECQDAVRLDGIDARVHAEEIRTPARCRSCRPARSGPPQAPAGGSPFGAGLEVAAQRRAHDGAGRGDPVQQAVRHLDAVLRHGTAMLDPVAACGADQAGQAGAVVAREAAAASTRAAQPPDVLTATSVPAVMTPPLGHDLDDVRAPLGALADRGAQRLGAPGLAAHVPAMAAGRGDRRARGHDRQPRGTAGMPRRCGPARRGWPTGGRPGPAPWSRPRPAGRGAPPR